MFSWQPRRDCWSLLHRYGPVNKDVSSRCHRHTSVSSVLSERLWAALELSQGKPSLSQPPFCSRQLGSATDKFATVHVTVVSADNGECGSAPARSRQFNEICHCLFARCLFICPFKQSTVVWRHGGGRAINSRVIWRNKLTWNRWRSEEGCWA